MCKENYIVLIVNFQMCSYLLALFSCMFNAPFILWDLFLISQYFELHLVSYMGSYVNLCKNNF